MKEVTVEKRDLLDTLIENRTRHQETYRLAEAAYREKAKSELLAAADRIRTGGKVKMHFNLHQPEDHTEDYDTAIEMLRLHTGDEVTITTEDWKHYYKDQWRWKDTWRMTTESYVVN